MNSSNPATSPSYAILLVDDNVHGMVARRRVLLDLGYQVQTATSGEEALKIVTDGHCKFNVIVTDFRMLSMDGIELIARVKAICPGTRTILLSALVEPWGMTEESTGADAVIAKSAAEMGQLTRTVQRFVAKPVNAKPVKKKPAAAVKRAAAANVVENG